jgi:hypothetical protein
MMASEGSMADTLGVTPSAPGDNRSVGSPGKTVEASGARRAR